VIRGPQSALWGSDALAGVVNIISAPPREGLRASLSAETGSAEWSRLSGGIGAAGERGHFMFNAGRFTTDGYNVSRTGDERDGYENASMRLAGGLNLSPGIDVSMSLRSIDSRSEFDGTDFSSGLPTDRLNTTDRQQTLTAMRLEADALGGRWLHEVRLDRLETENLTHAENPFAASGFDAARADAVVDGFTYQSGFALSDVHRIALAFERREESFVQRGPVSFGDPNRNERMDTESVVVEYDLRPTDALSILVSWRHDSNSDFDDAATKRISGAWRLGDGGTRLRAAYGEGVKNPTFTERFGYFTDFLGNPALRPERSHSAEVGVDHTFAEARVHVSATIFDEELEDEINGFVFDVASAAFTSVNQPGRSARRGLELQGAWNAGEVFAMQMSWTVLDAEEFDTGEQSFAREIRRPVQTANVGMHWNWLQERLRFAVNIDYSSQQDDYFFPPVPPFQQRVTLDGFSLLTLSAQYELASALQVFGRIENGMDEVYEEVFGFRSNRRQLFVGVRYRL
jgi:vitamin B12 transporter